MSLHHSKHNGFLQYCAAVIVTSLVIAFSIPSFQFVYASITEVVGGRADLELSLRAAQEPIDDVNSPLGRNMTDENVAMAQEDAGNVPFIFDRVVAPLLDSFPERHAERLEDRYVDRIHVKFNSLTNEVGIVAFLNIERREGSMNTWVGESNELGEQEIQQLLSDSSDNTAAEKELKFVNVFSITIPAQFTYSNHTLPPSTYAELKWKTLAPNTSARIAYLSEQIADTIGKNRDQITSDMTVDGVSKNKILDSIQAVMFEDMSRVTIDSSGRGDSSLERVAEYYTGFDFIIPESLHYPQGLEVGEPIHFVKPATKDMMTAVTAKISASDAGLFNVTVTYPDGKTVAMPYSGKGVGGIITYRLDLGPEEPAGLYSVLVQADDPELIVYINVDVEGSSSLPEEGANLTARTDRPSYQVGDTVTISGTVSSSILRDAALPTLIRIINPEGDNYRLDQLLLARGDGDDGSYSYEMEMEGTLGSIKGEYKIVVAYAEHTAETSFTLT